MTDRKIVLKNGVEIMVEKDDILLWDGELLEALVSRKPLVWKYQIPKSSVLYIQNLETTRFLDDKKIF